MQEFKAGQEVTYKSYEKAIRAKVIEVIEPPTSKPHPFIGMWSYQLEGVNESLVSHCTGRSIIESQYYKEYNPDTFWNE